jgi:hypothetical protein
MNVLENRFLPDRAENLEPVVFGQVKVEQNHTGRMLADAPAMVVYVSECGFTVGQEFKRIFNLALVKCVAQQKNIQKVIFYD